MPVSQMTAVSEIHTEDGRAGFECRHIDRNIRLRARMRLNVRVFGAEELRGSVDRQPFDAVDILAAAVVAFSRIAFGILVRENRTHRFEHRFRDEILGRDQLEARSPAGAPRRATLRQLQGRRRREDGSFALVRGFRWPWVDSERFYRSAVAIAIGAHVALEIQPSGGDERPNRGHYEYVRE